MRRFEFIQGNQAKFWEVTRRGATLTVASGRIGGPAKTRTKQLADYMVAEQEFDRLIRDKLRRGYVEVHVASEPEQQTASRPLRLVPVDGSAPLDLPAAATRYIIWRMVEVGAMDRQAESPDLERWIHRAARRMRLEEPPDPDDGIFDEFWNVFLELSRGDRSAETGQSGVVGGYKFTDPSEWIVTGKESVWLAEAAENRTPRRHKMTDHQERWVQEWITFHHRVADTGGYTVDAL
ncbi:MAG: WGR domain-containing protein [Myxococcota bacterium]